ncbi:MAG: DEAD/DEAH box helicase [Longimicrobiales bacterium]
MTSFRELDLAEPLQRAVDELGWDVPTPIQIRAIPIIRAGRDLVGIAQTGTGKTAAFVLPALERQLGGSGLRTLVLCPTRELAQQVASAAAELGQHTELYAGAVYGGVPIRAQIRDLRAGLDLLVATPGRLLDHLERGTVDFSHVDLLILDEADRMLDMGFRPQIEAVLEALPRQRQTLLFSATMPRGVHALALRILREPEWLEASPTISAAETVQQRVYSVRPDRKVDLLLHLLEQPGMDQVLVFTRTKVGGDMLYHRLRSAGIDVTVTHGDRSMAERVAALESFRSGEHRVLVATDVAQRGLDVEGISHVVNFDVPQDPEDYVHRIGRTGRAGATGDAVTFMTAPEFTQIKAIQWLLGYEIERVSLRGFDYAGGVEPKPAAVPAATAGRARGRLGTRRTDELTPEQLAALLSVG